MYITRWNPTREAMNLRDAMDRLFWSEQDSGPRVASLPVDAYSTNDEIVVTAAVPGVKPEDVEITVEGETLTIRGEIPARAEDTSLIFAERFHGPFARTLQLNVPVEVNDIKATFEDGVLTLTLPKAEEVRPKVIKVQAK